MRRAIDEALKRASKGDELPQEQRRRWKAAAGAKHLKAITRVPSCLGEAIDVLDRAAAEVHAKAQRARHADWARTFTAWTRAAPRKGAKVLRGDADVAAFTAEEMREAWMPHWGREAPRHDAAREWRKLAAEAGCMPTPTRTWIPPSLEEFMDAVTDTAGSEGFDGWAAVELCAFAKHTQWVLAELRTLLVRTTYKAVEGLSASERERRSCSGGLLGSPRGARTMHGPLPSLR